MLLPSKTKDLLRKYEKAIFHSGRKKNHKIYALHLLLRPTFNWITVLLLKTGLTPVEVESELYLLVERLYTGYDLNRSSIVPYLENQIPWKVSELVRKVSKPSIEDPSGLISRQEESYEIQEEYYWSAPKILLEERYIGKCFTKSEKYFIYKMLIANDNRLSKKALADDNNMSRQRVDKLLQDLQEVFNMEVFNVKSNKL